MAKDEKTKTCKKHSSTDPRITDIVVHYKGDHCPVCDMQEELEKSKSRIVGLKRSVWDSCPDCDGPFTPDFTAD